ncbi:MAG: prenyltransferase [Candidatus Saccharibacteria bacterium]|nr:prenyltransferase [Candidatus Saccharibacteria bacterium]
MSSQQRSLSLPMSRPRFWGYLFGPFLIGVAAAPQIDVSIRLVLLGLFFTFPANLLIYGFNDIFDYQTDKLNKKKRSYEKLLKPEQRKSLTNVLTVFGALGILLVFPESVPMEAKWAMTAFYFFGLGYSVPPIRAKTKPILDSYFNVLYVFPGLVSYGLLTGGFPPLQVFVAATMWCAAMHAYSAIPDIRADQRAGLRTVATTLGKQRTLLFCALHYTVAASLSAPWLGWFSLVGAAVYLSMMYVSFQATTKEQFFRYYTYFPFINMFVGAALFLWILWL